MSLDLVIAFVISIALAFITGPIIARKLNRKYLPSIVVSLLLLVIMTSLSVVLILSPVGPQDREHEIRKEISTLPFYEVMVENDSYFPGAVKQEIALSMAYKESTMAAIERVDQLIGRRMSAFFPIASDEALIRYSTVNMDALEFLLEIDTVAAYQYLAPFADDDYSWYALLPDSIREALYNALAETIRTGAKTPTVIADQVRADSLLVIVLEGVYRRYGDVEMLITNPALADINKAGYCRVVASLFRGALALPQPENAEVLRTLYSEEP